MRTMLMASVLAAVAGSAAAGIEVFTFDAFNHPDGSINPQAYGLRLDHFGGNTRTTFSFESGGVSTVDIRIVADNVTGAATLEFSGTVFGNSATGGTNFGTYALDLTYTGTYNFGTGRFTAIHNAGSPAIGTITALNVTGASPVAQGNAFVVETQPRSGDQFSLLFGQNLPGSRLPNGDDRFEGFGWVETSFSSGTQDFLFTAVQTVVPGPAPLALAGFGLAFAAGRRRR